MKRKIVLLVSVTAGVLAAVLTRFYIHAKDIEVRELKESYVARYGGEMWVLCFSRDVPSGTVLSREDLMCKKVPVAAMRGVAVPEANVSDVVGRKLLYGRKRLEPLCWHDVEGGDPEVRGLSADIKRQMRAVSINCSGAASVSSMVRPNDHVDVIATFDMSDAAERGVSRTKSLVTCTLLQNVLVLATGQQTAKSGTQGTLGSSGYSLVTLEVTPREAEMLAFAEQIRGRIVLALRNANDTHYEKELPRVNFDKICNEIEELNTKRQQQRLTGH